MFKKFFNKGKTKETRNEPKPVSSAEKVTEPKQFTNPKPLPKPDQGATMVPIFSFRTVIVVAIGLILGLMLGLVYWILSPSIGGASSGTTDGEDEIGTGFIGFLGLDPEGPYQSKVRIQVVSPGSEYIPLKNLQQMGEYYSAKASSLPFLEFLERKLPQQMLGFTYDVDKLGQMITSTYEYGSELPIIEISVIAETQAEAAGLAEIIPFNFRDYLTTEEQEQKQKEYDATLAEIDSVKATLYDAQKELNELNTDEIFNTNPSYIIHKAKVDALQQLLDTQVIKLASEVIEDKDINTEYDNIIKEISAVSSELDKANLELETILPPESEADNSNVTNIKLSAEISALQRELDRAMTGYTMVIGNSEIRIAGLAEMIANNDTTGPAYTALVEKIDVICQALADAQKQKNDLNIQSTQPTTSLEYQLVKIKTDTLNVHLSILQDKARQLYQQIITTEHGNSQPDTQDALQDTSAALAEAKIELVDLERQLGYDRLAAELEYKIAEDKVLNLNIRLEELTEQLGVLVGDTVELSETDYLVAGNPTTSSPVLPERGRARNTLLIGAIAGVVIAWGLLNYRWIIKGMPSSTAAKTKEDSEEE